MMDRALVPHFIGKKGASIIKLQELGLDFNEAIDRSSGKKVFKISYKRSCEDKLAAWNAVQDAVAKADASLQKSIQKKDEAEKRKLARQEQKKIAAQKKKAALDFANDQAYPEIPGAAEARARAREATRLRKQAEAKARAQADAKAQAEAEADAKAQAEAEAEAKARAEAEAKARAEAEAKAQAEAEAEALEWSNATVEKQEPQGTDETDNACQEKFLADMRDKGLVVEDDDDWEALCDSDDDDSAVPAS